MPVLKLSKEDAEELIWGGYKGAKTIVNEIVDTSRWSVHKRLIFKLEDKFYEVFYSKGATECQEQEPFEYQDEVICTEVEPYEKTVIDYRAVKEVADAAN